MNIKLMIILALATILFSCRKSYECQFASIPNWEYSNIKKEQSDALRIQCENEGGVWVSL